ncbi:hypothetical protein PINS_up005632 [Pythium insidiosum]|nr:hypothetical protein PINS_up005632 [Pythium insidiosum]
MESAQPQQSALERRARLTETSADNGETPANVTDEIAHLSKKSDVLSAEIESLKSCFAQREEQVSRLLSGLGTLSRVERELQQLQSEYQDCSRKDLEMIQDALKRVSDCLTQVDRLQRSGNVTSMELQTFRKDCKRQIESLLFKLDEVSDATRVAAATASEKGMDQFLELRDEISACKNQLSEIEPRRAEVENDFFQRMERFSVQLDHLRLQMSKMEQDLLQENELCRKSLESLVTRQMLQFRQLQKSETKRLQEEMDELRSDMCELLKEMHLLKERTKYLGPDSRFSPQQGVYGQPSRRGTSLARSTLPPDSQPSSYSGYQYGGHDDRYLYDHSQYCHYHHCPAGIPHISRPEEPALSIQSSPRRPSPVTLPPEPRMPTGIVGDHDAPQSCPSPHYSSRSSSVSGRISVTRDEHSKADAPVDEEELERRLLEQHRLFWIGEAARSGTLPSPRLPPEPLTPSSRGGGGGGTPGGSGTANGNSQDRRTGSTSRRS